MQDFAWLDDWLNELQSENTAEEGATVKDHSASIDESINPTQNENNALDTCLPTTSGYSNYGTSPGSSNTAPIYFQDNGPSCHDFTFGSSVNANRGKTTRKSANYSNTDAYNCRADRPDPPGINWCPSLFNEFMDFFRRRWQQSFRFRKFENVWKLKEAEKTFSRMWKGFV